MTINSYLTNLAGLAILRDDEKAGVQRSITTLQTRLVSHFGFQVRQHFVFGSYSRGTILPRLMDPQSDVDYMVIFSDSGLQPQSYLDRLRRFAEIRYTRSEVAQSHPTVVLDLNHIRFELVPALQSRVGGLQIPVTGSGNQSWQETNPVDFNDKLTRANQANGNLIKPLARVMKYWNATAGYPFESYALEKQVARHSYGMLTPRQLSEYFFQIVDALDAGLFAPQWKRDAVTRLKQFSMQARAMDHAGQAAQAETIIAKLLPPVGGLLRR